MKIIDKEMLRQIKKNKIKKILKQKKKLKKKW